MSLLSSSQIFFYMLHTLSLLSVIFISAAQAQVHIQVSMFIAYRSAIRALGLVPIIQPSPPSKIAIKVMNQNHDC